MKLKDIHIRDPYIFADIKTKTYYLYSNFTRNGERCFCVYSSKDLDEWSQPKIIFEQSKDFWGKKDFWAPEVHYYNGKYYMFATFSSNDDTRNCSVLVSDTPDGTFKVHLSKIFPEDWYSLDATLYVENGRCYAIFAHEWVQIHEGDISFVELSNDLSQVISEPKVLFKATEAGWPKNPCWNDKPYPIYITDGPFVTFIKNKPILTWSSFTSDVENLYGIGVVYPKKGLLAGEYKHQLLKLPKPDSGHAMTFTDFDGRLRIVYHENNSKSSCERAAIYYLDEKDGEVFVHE